ncbi:MAG: HlyC/CorC family transporter [Planctomycetota bacterium]|nr:MAG: HlyC/CorC family transporter [Planctomycetota bacterium]
MSCTALIVLVICLLAASTLFFSVNGIALRSFSRTKLQDAFETANKKRTPKRKKGHLQTPDDLVDSLVENSEKLILSCSVYRLIFNTCILLLLLAAFETAHQGIQVADYLLTFIIAAAIFSIFSLAIPHAWAKYAGEKILSRTHKLLMAFSTLVSPILYIFKLYDSLVKRLAGIVETTPDQQQEEKQEEFLNGLEQQRTEGVLDEEQQQMIENILELSETCADEIMTPRTDIVAVEVNSDLNTILDTITSAGHTRVPVYENNIDNIIGLVYAKDLLTEIGKNTADFKLRNKIRDAYFVPETKPLRVLLHEFQNQKLHIAIVLDEYGGTAGVVTLEDILEELVGEITDEYEEKPPEPVKEIDQNTIEADARTYVDDLNDQFELSLPEDEDYDTIGGFVFSRLGYIPKTGETFNYENLKLTITSAETRRIKRIRIQKTYEQ